jgi:predicted acylesterase/phospholipase RssA
MPNAGLLVTGEAMKTAFQAGYTVELMRQAADLGWAHPFRVSIGSSSGSLAAVVAALGDPPDHDLTLRFSQQFAADLRPGAFLSAARPGRWELPYRAALERIFDNHHLLQWDKAFDSPTTIVIVTTEVDVRAASGPWGDRLQVLADGVQRALGGEPVSFLEVAGRIAELSAVGTSGFLKPCYFSTKPWPREAPGSPPENWSVLNGPSELRQAVVASTRIPPFTGMPVKFGDRVLIDGAWSDNVPAWLAPALGIEKFFIVDCTRKGKLYRRPIGDYVRRQARTLLRGASRVTEWVEQLLPSADLETWDRNLRGLHDFTPNPTPIDLKGLEEGSPRLKIFQDHLTDDAPNPYRFWAPKPAVIEALYRLGVEKASARAADLSRNRPGDIP